MDDRSLAAAAARGDQQAFTELVERYRNYIYAIAYRIALNEDDALDISQNVLLRLVEKIGKYRGEGAFRAWLATLTSREAISFVRRAARRHETAVEPETIAAAADSGLAAPNPGPRETLDRAQHWQLVEEAMASLSPQQRAIFGLRFREELMPKEIAERLDIPSHQVRSQLHRAVTRIREKVAGQDGRLR